MAKTGSKTSPAGKSVASGAAARRAATVDFPAPGPVDMAVIENNIGYRLRLAFLAFFRSLDEVLAPFELRPGLVAVLMVIESNPGQKQQEIGRAVGIKRPNLVLVIDELEQRGLVRRHQAPGDGRSYALRLTPVGVLAMKEIRAAHDAHEQSVLATLGPDREAFLRALKTISEI